MTIASEPPEAYKPVEASEDEVVPGHDDPQLHEGD